MGYLWGDLKEENMGIDKNGKVKVFDFGETQLISEIEYPPLYYFSDIIAFGKFFLNGLIKRHFCQPGAGVYFSRGHGSDLELRDYNNILSNMDGEPVLVQQSKLVLRECFSLNRDSSKADVQSVIDGFDALFLFGHAVRELERLRHPAASAESVSALAEPLADTGEGSETEAAEKAGRLRATWRAVTGQRAGGLGKVAGGGKKKKTTKKRRKRRTSACRRKPCKPCKCNKKRSKRKSRRRVKRKSATRSTTKRTPRPNAQERIEAGA
jgi:hypothetical protein